VLLVCSGITCARSYLRLAVSNVAACCVRDLSLVSMTCSRQSSVVPLGLQRCRLPADYILHAANALSSVACLGELSSAAHSSLVSVTECFNIFDRPFTVRLQQDVASSHGSDALLGVHDHVLSDHAVSVILLNAGSSCHFPLVSPNRRLRSSCVLQTKIW
jgi:hypothetical protein